MDHQLHSISKEHLSMHRKRFMMKCNYCLKKKSLLTLFYYSMSTLIFLFPFSPSDLIAQVADPYQHVVFVTNTVSWPYDKNSYGTHSFLLGKNPNEDTIILNRVIKQGLHFPASFAFGVACSAYQYEGHRIKPNTKLPNGVGWSIWDVFSEKNSWLNPQGTNIANIPPTSRFTIPSGKKAILGFYPHYYHQDIKLVKELGVSFFRLSISWPRLFPHKGMRHPDMSGIQYYQQILEKLRSAHLNVLITLYHWDLPAWLYNFGDDSISNKDKTYGWLDMHEAKDNLILKEFQKYVAACYQAFGKYTPYFSTFNEPLTFTNSAFTDGVHAPGQYGWQLLQKKNKKLYGSNFNEYLERVPYLQAINIIKAHFIAYRTIHHLYDTHVKTYKIEPNVSIVLNSDWPEPYRIICNKNESQCYYHRDDIKASKNNMDFMLGWWLNPVMFGKWPESMNFIYKNRIKDVGITGWQETSCLQDDGLPVKCSHQTNTQLSDYISQGGALDSLAINHYTGYFAVQSHYAKTHFKSTPLNNAVPPDQYQHNPHTLKKGWYQDQHAFITQFRYRKLGDHGQDAGKDRVFIIGDAGNRPWLRQTWFTYRKLLQYINRYYLHVHLPDQPKQTKSNILFADLPIYLTENGTSIYHESQSNNKNDVNRIRYLLGNLGAIQEAVNKDKINVKLYTYWSIADNFEWSEGYDTRFGLVHISYDQQYARTPKQSFYCYQKIIKNVTKGKLPESCDISKAFHL